MTRSRDEDACPGALHVHQAADGALARVRLPGGILTPDQLERLALAAIQFGSPAMELTSRGNIQVRAITDTAGLADALTTAGLLPSASHEKVRNIVASPLSGRRGGLGDVRPLVLELDEKLQRTPALAELPGRFLFSLDDGRGDVSGLTADAGAHLVSSDRAALLIAGVDSGVRVPVDRVVDAVLAVALAFLEQRGKSWRTTELENVDQLLGDFEVTAEPGATWAPTLRPPVGWIQQDDGRIALGAAVPLGVLQARTAQYLAAVGAPLVVTPWRSVLVCDLDEGVADTALRVLAPLGLIFDETSPWLDVSACTGSPGCAHSAADVRSDATAAVRECSNSPVASLLPTGTNSPVASLLPTGHRHFVGCDRACGSPATGEVLVATGDGYRTRRP